MKRSAVRRSSTTTRRLWTVCWPTSLFVPTMRGELMTAPTSCRCTKRTVGKRNRGRQTMLRSASIPTLQWLRNARQSRTYWMDNHVMQSFGSPMFGQSAMGSGSLLHGMEATFPKTRSLRPRKRMPLSRLAPTVIQAPMLRQSWLATRN